MKETSHTMSQRESRIRALWEGADAARDLDEALCRAGFKLPSLRGDLPAMPDKAHVWLGGASAMVVRELAAWIRERV